MGWEIDPQCMPLLLLDPGKVSIYYWTHSINFYAAGEEEGKAVSPRSRFLGGVKAQIFVYTSVL